MKFRYEYALLTFYTSGMILEEVIKQMVVNQKCYDDDVDVDDDDGGGGGGAAVLSKFNDTVILTKNNTDVAGNGKEH